MFVLNSGRRNTQEKAAEIYVTYVYTLQRTFSFIVSQFDRQSKILSMEASLINQDRTGQELRT
jgi:hypothetical protein